MELRVTRRWAHWGFAIVIGALMLLFGVMIVATLRNPAQMGEGIRIRPFPTKSSVTVDRGDIRLAYARTRLSFEEGQEVGREYSAGVETRQSLQFDVTGPQPSIETALERAQGIVAVLLGGIWEVAATSTNIRYSGPRFW